MASAVMNIPGRSPTGSTQTTRGPGTADIKPRVTDLMNILAEIAPQYLDIGVALNVPDLGLHPLPQYYNDNLRRTLQWWIDNGPTVGSPVTYDNIIEAIKGQVVQNFRVSEKLREFYEQLKEDQPMSLANNETGPSDGTQYDENRTPNISQNTMPHEAQSSGMITRSSSHPPLPPSVPFTLLYKPGRVSTCFGCRKKFSKRVERLLIVHHEDYRHYINPRTGLPSQKFENVYYHLKMTCTKKNLGRSIPASHFVVPDRLKEELSPDEKAKISNELNITI